MKDLLKNKKLVIGVLAAVVVLLGGVMFMRSRQSERNLDGIIPTEAIIPTVDSSVKVALEPTNKKGEVTLTVKSAPRGTKSIEYTISYDAQSTNPDEGEGVIPQGAIGKCEEEDGVWHCGEPTEAGGRKIVLGTCSSGVCRYHQIVGKIKVYLKFSGSYGEKAFEKDYEI